MTTTKQKPTAVLSEVSGALFSLESLIRQLTPRSADLTYPKPAEDQTLMWGLVGHISEKEP